MRTTGAFTRAWNLFKLSWRVASHDKELILLEVFAFIITIIGLAVIWLPTVFIGWDFSAGEPKSAIAFYFIPTLLSYWVAGATFTFFRGAQIAGMHKRLTGGDPTVRGSIEDIQPVAVKVIQWGIFTATVTFILEALRSAANGRGGGGGNFVVSIFTHALGAAWNFLTFLTLPIVIFEKLGPIKALKRSGQVLKKVWGTQLVANIGSSFVVFLLMLPGIAIITLGALAGGIGLVLGLVIGGLYLIGVGLWWTLVTSAYQAALYIYATTGTEPEAFAGADFATFFGQKKDKGKATTI